MNLAGAGGRQLSGDHYGHTPADLPTKVTCVPQRGGAAAAGTAEVRTPAEIIDELADRGGQQCANAAEARQPPSPGKCEGAELC
jgi:hypothetical protein